MRSNLAPDSREPDPILGCIGDGCVLCLPLLLEGEYLVEVHLRVVSVMGKLAASVNDRLSVHLTLSGMCV